MVKYVVFLLLSFSFISVFAQNNATEAKAAYLLAEEEFNAGKYESAISYLNQATEKLGAPNAKILYLKIMALQAMPQRDDAQVDGLIRAIEAFEKAADIESFNEEKKLEVYKLKLKTARLLEARPKNPLEVSVYSLLKVSGLKLGMNLEELQAAEPDFFAKAIKYPNGDKIEYTGAYRAAYLKLIVMNQEVKQIDFYPAVSNELVKNTALVTDIRMKLGGNPVENSTNKVDGNKKFSTTTTTRTLTWMDQNVRVELAQIHIISKNKQETKQYNYVVLSLIDGSL